MREKKTREGEVGQGLEGPRENRNLQVLQEDVMTSGKSLTKHEVTQKVLRARGGVQKKGWGWGGGGWVGSQL